MERHLERVIRTSLADARAAGLDYSGQTNRVVRELLLARPDLSDIEAFRAIDQVRWEMTV